MKAHRAIALLFLAAALYDGLLGLAFLFAAEPVFQWCAVTPPNHFGYVQFPAALLIVFAVMFLAMAQDPFGKRGLIPYGILLKLSYCAVISYHWLATDIPYVWKPFVLYDCIFLMLFVWAYGFLKQAAERAPRAGPDPAVG